MDPFLPMSLPLYRAVSRGTMSAACQSLPVAACESAASKDTEDSRASLSCRHPAGFYTVCLAVLCERCAGYILGASMVFLLCERYGYARGDALRLAGLVNAASYLSTLPGGLVVDHVLGSRRAFGAGMALLALGYAALTLSAPAALWLSLLLLVLGHALFKPGTQAVIAGLYSPNDVRIDAAQVAFYMAVNAGAAVGAGIAGLLMRGHDWRTSFAVAAAVMLMGRIVLALGRNTLRLRQKGQAVSTFDIPTSGSLSAWQRARGIGALILALMLYTIGFGQVEGSLFLWAQDRTDRVLFGFEIPAAWFVGLPAILVLILAPVQLAVLPWIQRRVNTKRLVEWGLVAVALAFAVLAPPVIWSAGHRVSMAWLIACMTLLVIGELLVAPLGLSMILRLAPPRFVGVVVGAWYVSGALGYWLAGEIGAMWVRWNMG